jgi:hypothetical protein
MVFARQERERANTPAERNKGAIENVRPSAENAKGSAERPTLKDGAKPIASAEHPPAGSS